MRILVTGGAGFIGSHLVDALIAAGCHVGVIDDLSTGLRENVNPAATLYETSVAFRYGISGTPELPYVFEHERPEAVYHLAAQSCYRVGLEQPVHDAEQNVIGTVNVLEACRLYGACKLIFASSGAVYGEPDALPVSESAPVRPLSPYGASKAAGELYVRLYGDTYGLDYTILRLGNVYGPRQRPDGEAGVVAIFAGHMLRGEPVTVNGDGGQTRDFVYVGDVVRAFVKALSAGRGATLNIATGYATSVLEVAMRLHAILGIGDILYGPPVHGEPRLLRLDPGAALRVLGWDAMELNGLWETVEWLRERQAATAGKGFTWRTAGAAVELGRDQ